MSASAKKKAKKRKKGRGNSGELSDTSLTETAELYSHSISMAAMQGCMTPQGGQYGESPTLLYNTPVAPMAFRPPVLQYPAQPFTQQPQMPNVHPATNATRDTGDNWLQQILHRFDMVEKRLSALDQIQTSVLKIEQRVDRIETDFKGRLSDLEKTASFLSDKYEEQKQFNDNLDTKVQEALEKRNCETEQSGLSVLAEKVTDLQARSMRDNLIFKGIPESAVEYEDCEKVIQDFIRKDLGVDGDFQFERVHRMGRWNKQQRRKSNSEGEGDMEVTLGAVGGEPEPGHTQSQSGQDNRTRPYGPRSIVAKFNKYKDRERVRQAAVSGRLTGTGFFVDEQFPREIEDKRRVLYPIRSAAKYAGDDVYLSVDKLYINDTLYDPGKPVRNSKCAVLRKTHDPEEIRKSRRERAQYEANRRRTDRSDTTTQDA